MKMSGNVEEGWNMQENQSGYLFGWVVWFILLLFTVTVTNTAAFCTHSVLNDLKLFTRINGRYFSSTSLFSSTSQALHTYTSRLHVQTLADVCCSCRLMFFPFFLVFKASWESLDLLFNNVQIRSDCRVFHEPEARTNHRRQFAVFKDRKSIFQLMGCINLQSLISVSAGVFR